MRQRRGREGKEEGRERPAADPLKKRQGEGDHDTLRLFTQLAQSYNCSQARLGKAGSIAPPPLFVTAISPPSPPTAFMRDILLFNA